MKRKMRYKMAFVLFLSILLSACNTVNRSSEETTSRESAQEAEEMKEQEAINEYGLTGKQQEAFVRIYEKYQKGFMQDFMKKSNVEDPRELFQENLPLDERWAGIMVDLAKNGIYNLESIKASMDQVEHYNKGYVFEHAVVEWMEEEDIGAETWQYLMDEHIQGDMGFIENVMRPAYLEVYHELVEAYESGSNEVQDDDSGKDE